MRGQARVEVRGERAGQPEDDQGEEDPDGQDLAEFWNVVFMPDPAPRCSGGRLLMTPARFGEPNEDMHRPVTKSSRANTQ